MAKKKGSMKGRNTVVLYCPVCGLTTIHEVKGDLAHCGYCGNRRLR